MNDGDALQINTDYKLERGEALENVVIRGFMEVDDDDLIRFTEELKDFYEAELHNNIKGQSASEIADDMEYIRGAALAGALKLKGVQRIHRREFEVMLDYLEILAQKDDESDIQG